MRALKPTAALVAAAVWNRLRPPSGLRDCILCYHSVHPNRPFRTCRPADFEVQLDWLAEHCEVVAPLGLLQPREQGLTRPRVAITFDDGYIDNYEHAFPLLRERGLPATFFVTTGLIERDPVALARFELLRR
jgi:peptidoglycan/xylan/chitin deacetylase (PgdA/CDA1 family)